MRARCRRAGPAILASGLTVTLAMLVAGSAPTSGDPSSLGPVAAIAVFTAMVAGLTLLPGAADDLRPARVLAATQPGRLRPRARVGRASRALAAVRRSGPAAAGAGAGRDGRRLLAPAPSACSPTRSTTRRTSFFKHSVESVDGFDVFESSFPAGTLAPTTVLVESDGGPVTPADIADASAER